jgi:hypothetical protein
VADKEGIEPVRFETGVRHSTGARRPVLENAERVPSPLTVPCAQQRGSLSGRPATAEISRER